MAATFTPTHTYGAPLITYWEPGVMYVPGDPGDTFAPGDFVTFTVGEGIADLITTNEDPMAVVAAGPSIACPSLSTGFPHWGSGDADIGKILTDEAKTLIPIIPLVADGTIIARIPFEDYLTDDVISYSATVPNVALTTGVSADDYPNGALVYVYSGTGIGQWNVVADYDHTGGAAELELIFHRKFKTALDATSDLLILAGEGASNKGVGFFGRSGHEDRNNLEVDDHANDGKWVVFADARTIHLDLARGLLPVVKATAMGLLA